MGPQSTSHQGNHYAMKQMQEFYMTYKSHFEDFNKVIWLQDIFLKAFVVLLNDKIFLWYPIVDHS